MIRLRMGRDKKILLVAGCVATASLALVAPAGRVQATGTAASAVAPGSVQHSRGDIAGNWQGTLQAGQSLRTILTISKVDKGFTATMYSIDQGALPIKATSVTLNGSTFKYLIDMIGGSYEGTLSSDNNSIVGT